MAIRRIGVVGAGTMGSGIAQKIAQEGFEVVLVDVSEEFVEKGVARIRDMLDEAVRRGIFTAERVEEILGRVRPTVDRGGLADCDMVIEAVFEDPKVKGEVFSELDGICGPECIFATNTSSLKVSDLAGATSRPGRFVGFHYFYHPAKNRLLEVIPGERTGKEVLEESARFGRLHGKTVIVVKDAPGFAVNRYFVPWLNEATRILEEGLADCATVDGAAKRAFGIGMGPFELMNVTGLPIAYHSCNSLAERLGSFYAPSETLARQVKAARPWDLAGEPDEGKFDEVARRLLGVVFYVAAQMLDEDVARLEDIDRGAKIGLRWRKGPFELMNDMTVPESFELIREVCARYGVSAPASMGRRLETGGPWPMEYVDYEVRDGVAWVVFNRPEAMNALNPTVMEQFAAAVDRALADEAAGAVVLSGAGGKAFVAGADINFFIERIEGDRFKEIYDFTAFGHEVLRRMETSPKRFVAAVDGFALGGGFEIALACHAVVATPRSSFALPETGIGIYPGLGGMHRSARRVGVPLARWLVLCGETVSATSAAEFGLVDHIAETAALEKEAARLALEKGPVEGRRVEPGGGWARLAALFDDDATQAWLAGERPAEGSEAERVAKALSRKAPVALRLAARIIAEGAGLPLEEALALDLKYLPEIFSTADALEGLKSVVERRRPKFVGK